MTRSSMFLAGRPARLSAFFIVPVLVCAPARAMAGMGSPASAMPAPSPVSSPSPSAPAHADDGGMAGMTMSGQGRPPSSAGSSFGAAGMADSPSSRGDAMRGAMDDGQHGMRGRQGPAPAPPRDGPSAGRVAASGMAGMAHGMTMAGTPQGKKPRVVHKAVDAPGPVVDLGHHLHGMDMGRWFHGVLDEFEGRYQGGGNSSLRWDGEAWYGGDYNRLWLKSEGTMTRGRVRDGDQELLYSRAISTYFNLQGGVRLDIDSGPVRAWGAFGVEGLALYQFEMQATGYFNDRGVAGRLEGSYDILLTNRLILQPQVELNFYSHADPARQVGRGLADIDTGLRLRYELWRKMAPYVAVTYDSPLTQGRRMARQRGERASEARFTFGIRSWF